MGHVLLGHPVERAGQQSIKTKVQSCCALSPKVTWSRAIKECKDREIEGERETQFSK